jgi:nicotinamidase-related amidase
MPSRTAVLLLDLQVDFLDLTHGRMPVCASGAARVLSVANGVLGGRVVPGALPVLVVNAFPADDRIGNWFRRGAAVAGTAGAEVDPRLKVPPAVRVFSKRASSAFSNPGLLPYLRQQQVRRLYVVGVFAEGCVRATALAARQLGFEVAVAESGIATNARWKALWARWALRRGGVAVLADLPKGDDAG